MTSVDHLLSICAREIERRANGPRGTDVLREGAAAFSAAVAAGTPIDCSAERRPVVDLIGDLASSPLVDAVKAAAPALHWTVSPRVDDQGELTALAPLNDVWSLAPVTAGLLVLRPGGTYPLHSHPPQELYLPIADGGRWRYGGEDSYREIPEDGLVYNHPHDRHSIVAGSSVLLAIYVLWD